MTSSTEAAPRMKPGTIKAHRICFAPGQMERLCLIKAARKTKQQFSSLICHAIEEHLGGLLTDREAETLEPFKIRHGTVRDIILSGKSVTIRIGERAAVCVARESLRTGRSITDILCRCIRAKLQIHLPKSDRTQKQKWFEAKRKGFLSFVIDQAGSNSPMFKG